MRNLLISIISINLIFGFSFAKTEMNNGNAVNEVYKVFQDSHTIGNFYKQLYPKMTVEEKTFMQEKVQPIANQMIPKAEIVKHVITIHEKGNTYAIDMSHSWDYIYSINNHKFDFRDKSVIEIYQALEKWLQPSKSISSLFIPEANAKWQYIPGRDTGIDRGMAEQDNFKMAMGTVAVIFAGLIACILWKNKSEKREKALEACKAVEKTLSGFPNRALDLDRSQRKDLRNSRSAMEKLLDEIDKSDDQSNACLNKVLDKFEVLLGEKEPSSETTHFRTHGQ